MAAARDGQSPSWGRQQLPRSRIIKTFARKRQSPEDSTHRRMKISDYRRDNTFFRDGRKGVWPLTKELVGSDHLGTLEPRWAVGAIPFEIRALRLGRAKPRLQTNSECDTQGGPNIVMVWKDWTQESARKVLACMCTCGWFFRTFKL